MRNSLLSCVGGEAWSDLRRRGRRIRAGSPLTAGPRWRCSRNSDFSHARRQCLRAVAWPQHVERDEGEECSVRACREPLRVRSSSVRRRGSVITSDRQHVRLGNRFRRANWAPERVSPTTDASPGRRPLVRPPARAGSFLRRRMASPEKNDAARREPSRRRGSSTGFRRVTPVSRGRSRGVTFRTPRRAGRARISRGVCFSGDSSLLRW